MQDAPEPSLASTATLLWNELIKWYASLIKSLPNLFVACAIATLFWFVGKLVSRGAYRLMHRAGGNAAIHDLLARIVWIACVALGTFIALGVLDLQKTVMSLLAGAGVLGLVLGIAFQDIAANFFAGVLISLRKPYQVGDEVEVGGHLGAVTGINLRNTVLTAFDGSQVLVPNRKAVESNVINRTRYGKYRLTIVLRISFANDPKKLKSVLIPAIQQIEGVLPQPPVSIDFEAFTDNSQQANLRFWIRYDRTTTPTNSMRDAVFVRTKEVLDEHGFTVPFPMQNVAVQLTPAEKPEQRSEA